jgi:hypothetical protein
MRSYADAEEAGLRRILDRIQHLEDAMNVKLADCHNRSFAYRLTDVVETG